MSFYISLTRFNPLPDMPILDSSNSAPNTDIIKNMDKWGYNYLIEKKIVGKGGIAHYEQFLLFPQCFQKLSVAAASK